MTLKPTRNPYGYRELLVYQKADDLQSHCTHLTSGFQRGVMGERGEGIMGDLPAQAGRGEVKGERGMEEWDKREKGE